MEFMTTAQCEVYRDRFGERQNATCLDVVRLTYDMNFIKKAFWAMNGILVSGFAGTIFSLFYLGGA